MNNQLCNAAYHEAGHAVAAVVLRIPVEWASTIADFESIGHVKLGRGWVNSLEWAQDNRKHAAYATQSMAGVMALALRRHWRAATLDELRKERGDWGMVCDAALYVVGPGGDAAVFYRHARNRAERILRCHWPAVERIASALRRERLVTGREVRALVNGHQAVARSA